MFYIKILKMYWINGEEDNPNDLCLHGDVEIIIGNEIFKESGTISAMGIRLLKTITEDHYKTDGEQMLPCCGHFLIANDKLDMVTIIGCPNGIDWTTTHENNLVKITTESGNITCVGINEYIKTVYNIADEIENFYKKSSLKNVPEDEFESNGYNAFWIEWHNRRNEF